MADPELIDYIQQYRSQYSLQQIQDSLLDQGYSQRAIDQAIRAANQKQRKQQARKEQNRQQPKRQKKQPGSLSYAGFWKRFGAFIIDTVIVSILMTITYYVITFLGGLFGDTAAMIAAVLGWVLLSVLHYTYFAWFESSDRQATPGKSLLSLKVVDTDGRPISFWRALGRNIAKIASSAILSIGFIMIAFTDKKQGLHDKIASCLVVEE